MAEVVPGTVKWFDSKKGFGFITPNNGGKDILLHANVILNYGQSSVADGVKISVEVNVTDRGVQAARIVTLEVANSDVGRVPVREERLALVANQDELPWLPVRVKWFDAGKGFGFVNIFGRPGDVFIHTETLVAAGLTTLTGGEAIAIRVIENGRGPMAIAVAPWLEAGGGDTKSVAAE